MEPTGFEQGIASVRAGTKDGTAFLIAPQYALTAWHVVANPIGSESCPHLERITLHFHNAWPNKIAQPAKVCGGNVKDDWALLQLETALHDVQPLPIGSLRASYQGKRWISYGYPDLRPDGMHAGGTITACCNSTQKRRLHQLFCRELGASHGHRLTGMSGAPCIVEGVVVGILRLEVTADQPIWDGDSCTLTQEVAVGGTMFACPLEYVTLDDSAQLSSICPLPGDEQEHAFDTYRRLLSKFCTSRYRTLSLSGRGQDHYVSPTIRTDQGDISSVHSFLAKTASPDGKITIILQAPPGAGKSTFLRRIASELCTSLSPGPLEHGAFLPMALSLRGIASASPASLEDVLSHALANSMEVLPTQRLPSGFLDHWPNRFHIRWLLLLDGLDEVPQEQREAVNAIILRFAENYSCIVATRPIELGKGREFSEFRVGEVLPLDDTQQAVLIGNQMSDTESEGFRRWKSERSLDAILGNPLLLKLSMDAYADLDVRNSGKSIRRTALYEHFVNAWLSEAKGRGLATDMGRELADVFEDALEHLAADMLDSKDTTGHPAALAALGDFLEHDVGYTPINARRTAARLLDTVCNRSGLIVADGGTINWVHQSFCEYMTARKLARQHEPTLASCALIQDLIKQNRGAVALFVMGIWAESSDIFPILHALSILKDRRTIDVIIEVVLEGFSRRDEFAEELFDLLAPPAYLDAINGAWAHSCQGRHLGPIGQIGRLANLGILKERLDTLRKLLLQLANAGYARGVIWDLTHITDDEHLASFLTGTDVKPSFHVQSEIACRLMWSTVHHRARHVATQWSYTTLEDPNLPDWRVEQTLENLTNSGSDEALLPLLGNTQVPASVRSRIPALLRNSGSVDQCAALPDLEPELRVALEKVRRLSEIACRQVEGHSAMDDLIHAQNWQEVVTLALDPTTKLGVREFAFHKLCVNALHWEALKLMQAGFLRANCCIQGVRNLLYVETSRQWRAGLLPILTALSVPTEDRLWRNLIELRTRLRFSLGRHREALPDLNELVRLYPSDADPWADRGCAHWHADHPKKALADLNESLRLDPDSDWVLLRKGAVLWELDRYDESVASIVRALGIDRYAKGTEVHNASAWALRYLADSLVRCNRGYDGIAVFNEALRLNPQDAEAILWRGDAFFQLGMWRESLNDYRQANLTRPDKDRRKSKRAQCLLLIGDLQAAGKVFAEILVRSPSDESALGFSVGINLALGNKAAARSQAAGLLAANTSEPWYLYLAGLVELADGDHAQAQALFSKSLERTDETLKQERTCLSESNRALTLLALGHSDLAAQEYRDLLDHDDMQHLYQFTLPKLWMLQRIAEPRPYIKALYIELLEKLNQRRGQLQQGTRILPDSWAKFVRSYIEPIRQAHREISIQITEPQRYACGTYCSLPSIPGLEPESEQASTLLAQYAGLEPSLVLLCLDWKTDMFYGQCNFKARAADGHAYKFCDCLRTFVERQLGEIIRDFDLKCVIFDQEVACQRVKGYASLSNWNLECRLIAAREE